GAAVSLTTRLRRLEDLCPAPDPDSDSDSEDGRELTAEEWATRLERGIAERTYHHAPFNPFQRDGPDFARLWVGYHPAENRHCWTRRPEGGWFAHVDRVPLARVWVPRAEPDVEAARLAVLRVMVRVLAAAAEPAREVPALRALGSFLASGLDKRD